MILEVLLICGVLLGFLNARSITLMDRALSGNYFVTFGKSQFVDLTVSIIMFLGMVSTFALIVWGFVYIKWYFTVIAIIGSIILCQRSFFGKLFPFKDFTHLFIHILTIGICVYLWVIKIVF